MRQSSRTRAATFCDMLGALLSRLEEKRSPFENVTRQDIIDYWEAMQAINIDRDNPEECKKIVADCVQSATIRGKFLEVIIQHHLGGAVYYGVGGPTFYYPNCFDWDPK